MLNENRKKLPQPEPQIEKRQQIKDNNKTNNGPDHVRSYTNCTAFNLSKTALIQYSSGCHKVMLRGSAAMRHRQAQGGKENFGKGKGRKIR